MSWPNNQEDFQECGFITGKEEDEDNEEERKRKRRHLKPVKESPVGHAREGQDITFPSISATSSVTTTYFLNIMINCHKNITSYNIMGKT